MLLFLLHPFHLFHTASRSLGLGPLAILRGTFGARPVHDEEGAEGGQRDHDDGDASFHELLEYLPGSVDFVGWSMNPQYLNDRRDDHYDGKAEGKAQGKLLLKIDLYPPMKKDGNDDD